MTRRFYTDPREKIIAALGQDAILWFRCPKCKESGGIDGEQSLGRVSMVCPTEGCDFHETGKVEPVIFVTDTLKADQEFTLS